MQKSSSDSRARLAFRAVGAIFAAATVFFGWLFLYELHRRHQIRTGVLTYGLFTLASTVGLMQVRAWGRSFALVIALGSSGLGILVLLSTIFDGSGPVLVPSLFVALSIGVAVMLSRPLFVLPPERTLAPREDD